MAAYVAPDLKSSGASHGVFGWGIGLVCVHGDIATLADLVARSLYSAWPHCGHRKLLGAGPTQLLALSSRPRCCGLPSGSRSSHDNYKSARTSGGSTGQSTLERASGTTHSDHSRH